MEKVQYDHFGLDYVAGRRVTHLSCGDVLRSQCGVHRLGLKVKQDGSAPLCKRCQKTVKVLRILGRRIAIYRDHGEVTAQPEMIVGSIPQASKCPTCGDTVGVCECV
jgi:hypothetical protein